MPSVRLFADQAARLRDSGMGAEIIRQAVARYRRGELVVSMRHSRRKAEKLLQFNIGKVPEGITSKRLRAILDAHFATPLPNAAENEREIARLDREISAMMNELENVEFVTPRTGAGVRSLGEGQSSPDTPRASGGARNRTHLRTLTN